MAATQTTGKLLIESDRVEGTTVYDPQGNDIGSIKRLMIEKVSGRVAYAVMSFGGFLGIGAEEHSIPWNKLTYDTNLGGYRTDITEQQRQIFRAIETTIGMIGTENASCTATKALDPIGKNRAANYVAHGWPPSWSNHLTARACY
jgi:hypothetical protein